MNCRETTRLISEAQDRRLGLGERLQLRVHLLYCGGCRRFGTQMDVLRQLTRSYVKGEPPDEPPE